eukprot:GILJ01002584.1.p1 GENE.GILJ01002584.1~~GILJ01002584.1.p1  ORF type:complete len:724 (-),score=152.54 GILJ01002584.1:65-2236(-)
MSLLPGQSLRHGASITFRKWKINVLERQKKELTEELQQCRDSLEGTTAWVTGLTQQNESLSEDVDKLQRDKANAVSELQLLKQTMNAKDANEALLSAQKQVTALTVERDRAVEDGQRFKKMYEELKSSTEKSNTNFQRRIFDLMETQENLEKYIQKLYTMLEEAYGTLHEGVVMGKFTVAATPSPSARRSRAGSLNVSGTLSPSSLSSGHPSQFMSPISPSQHKARASSPSVLNESGSLDMTKAFSELSVIEEKRRVSLDEKKHMAQELMVAVNEYIQDLSRLDELKRVKEILESHVKRTSTPLTPQAAPGGFESPTVSAISWLSQLELSRPVSLNTLAADFSDGVCMAEIIHSYLPHALTLSDFTAAKPASNRVKKVKNWKALSSILEREFGIALTEETLEALTRDNPEAALHLLYKLKKKLISRFPTNHELSTTGIVTPVDHPRGSASSNGEVVPPVASKDVEASTVSEPVATVAEDTDEGKHEVHEPLAVETSMNDSMDKPAVALQVNEEAGKPTDHTADVPATPTTATTTADSEMNLAVNRRQSLALSDLIADPTDPTFVDYRLAMEHVTNEIKNIERTLARKEETVKPAFIKFSANKVDLSAVQGFSPSASVTKRVKSGHYMSPTSYARAVSPPRASRMSAAPPRECLSPTKARVGADPGQYDPRYDSIRPRTPGARISSSARQLDRNFDPAEQEAAKRVSNMFERADQFTYVRKSTQ